jgi:hypothetical protein
MASLQKYSNCFLHPANTYIILTLQKKNWLVNTLFDIGDKTKETAITLVEWGNHYCCIAGLDTVANRIVWLTYKTYTSLDDHSIHSIVNEIKTGPTVIVSSAFPEFILTPLPFNAEEALYQLYPNQKQSKVFTDTINEWQVKTQFLLPVKLYNSLQKTYTKVSFIHFFTTALKTYNGISAESQIAIQFAPEQFFVLVKKGGQLQLAQIYNYKSPLDVVYYLLKIIEESGMSINETLLVLSGLIEKESDLYKELYHYFGSIHFAIPATTIVENNNHPAHFFTSLYNLATCVS